MKKKKSGSVYFLECLRKNGDKPIYTGKTTRPVKTREKEHQSQIKSKQNKTWVSKSVSARLLGALPSKNPSKAEATIKKLKPHQKRYLARSAAIKFKKRFLK